MEFVWNSRATWWERERSSKIVVRNHIPYRVLPAKWTETFEETLKPWHEA
jgi:hypothetical protein